METTKSKKRKYPKDVYFRVVAEPDDDVDIRGNAMASGDDDVDREAEDEIIAGLESGNEWAWAYVKVIAEYEDDNGNQYEGHDGLGACSYKNERDFVRNSGYYEDMKEMAFDTLTANMERAGVKPPWAKKRSGGKRRGPHDPTLRPGYAFSAGHLRNWRTAPDDMWDIVMIEHVDGKFVGTRKIDSTPCAVFKGSGALRDHYYAQTTTMAHVGGKEIETRRIARGGKKRRAPATPSRLGALVRDINKLVR